MKKLIVKENKSNQDAEINKINRLMQVINKSILKFKADTGYSVSLVDIRSLIYGSSSAAELLKEKLTKHLDKELDGLNITSNLMRNNFKSGSDDLIKNLAKELGQLSSTQGIIHLDKLVLVNGCVTLPKEAEETIRDSFRNVVESEAAHELWNLQNEVAEKLQSLYSFIENNTPLHYYNLGETINNFFELNENKEVVIIDVDYERLTRSKALPV